MPYAALLVDLRLPAPYRPIGRLDGPVTPRYLDDLARGLPASFPSLPSKFSSLSSSPSASAPRLPLPPPPPPPPPPPL